MNRFWASENLEVRRREVMGVEQRAPTDEELDAMRALVRLVIVSGALILLGVCLAGWFAASSRLFFNLDPEIERRR